MATIKDFGVEGEGILHPVLSNRWKLRFSGSNRIVQPNNILTNQTVFCKLDMLKKKAHVKVEQSIIGEEYYQIQNLHNGKFTLRIDVVDGNDSVHYAIMLYSCELTKHEHDFDYSTSGILYHDLEISYTEYEILIPAIQTESPIEPTTIDGN